MHKQLLNLFMHAMHRFMEHFGVRFVGAKAANCAKIARILGAPGLPGAYALPFSAYLEHVNRCGATTQLTARADSDNLRPGEQLQIQQSILRAAVDADVVRSLAFCLHRENWPAAILRSSTNTEDLEGFNGVGH